VYKSTDGCGKPVSAFETISLDDPASRAHQGFAGSRNSTGDEHPVPLHHPAVHDDGVDVTGVRRRDDRGNRIINRLAADGLVHREPDPTDGRSTLIRLTPAGVALAERAVRATSAAHEAVFAGLPPEVVEAATLALRAIPAPAPADAMQSATARVRRHSTHS
jgi:hypothetical protein